MQQVHRSQIRTVCQASYGKHGKWGRKAAVHLIGVMINVCLVNGRAKMATGTCSNPLSPEEFPINTTLQYSSGMTASLRQVH